MDTSSADGKLTMGGRTAAILFSKDRALQSRAAVESCFLHVRDAEECALTVLYTASSPAHEDLYRALASDLPQVRFRRERDFKGDLLAALEGAESVLFMVDDNLFTRPFSPALARESLREHSDALGVSLRLGRNTFYCYSLARMQSLPSFQELGNGMLKYSWVSAEHDFGYPLEVSSSLYRIEDLRPILERFQFKNPNTLEGLLAREANRFQRTRPALLCLERSAAFCNPLNKVQDGAPWNRAGARVEYSPESLAALCQRGYRIDVAAYAGVTPISCHQEMPLVFAPRKGATPTAPPPAAPRVTVVMPVYDGRACIGEAIERVLRQTYSDFELLVIDDGSTDGTSAVVASFRDPRIRLHRMDVSVGIANALSTGLALARGEYVARIDADDVCPPKRLEREVEFMVAQPWAGAPVFQSPAEGAAILWAALFQRPFLHPCVMVRRESAAVSAGVGSEVPRELAQDLWIDGYRRNGYEMCAFINRLQKRVVTRERPSRWTAALIRKDARKRIARIARVLEPEESHRREWLVWFGRFFRACPREMMNAAQARRLIRVILGPRLTRCVGRICARLGIGRK